MCQGFKMANGIISAVASSIIVGLLICVWVYISFTDPYNGKYVGLSSSLALFIFVN